jgi:hypothetical protein
VSDFKEKYKILKEQQDNGAIGDFILLTPWNAKNYKTLLEFCIDFNIENDLVVKYLLLNDIDTNKSLRVERFIDKFKKKLINTMSDIGILIVAENYDYIIGLGYDKEIDKSLTVKIKMIDKFNVIKKLVIVEESINREIITLENMILAKDLFYEVLKDGKIPEIFLEDIVETYDSTREK